MRAWRAHLIRPSFYADDYSTRGRSLNPKIQKWSATGLAGLITSALGRLLADSIIKETLPPDQRSLEDDVRETVFHGLVSVLAVILTSVIVRRVFGRR